MVCVIRVACYAPMGGLKTAGTVLMAARLGA